MTLCGVAGHVHAGFLAAARHLEGPVTAALGEAAARCPGWPVLLCGHSLGGGVAAVLTMQLADRRQRAAAAAAAAAAAGQPPPPSDDPLSRLGPLRCIGVGAAAAFDERLGLAARGHGVTTVLYGCGLGAG